ncbi:MULTISPECIES: carboxypeptidase-like regulatory domain-containing protein [Bacillaceae]|uniref:Carboxypeptidase-like regulatory domain-containing protein n=1 Tax=Evansella alkalicola TaxID=745819 RepID=A0ABS6JQY1_9BACI|nr:MULTISPECIES: carboxypeptidase-like regulatory domain-containing protein [Bacillaceae]MBU9720888.1 carboxypeptidase-like regulatory domain-containing protein [Bacillus alkalicola]
MKVTIKMKHLVLGIGLFAILTLVFFVYITPKLDSWQIGRQLAAGEVEEGKQKIVDRIEGDARNKLELIEEYMIASHSEGFDVYVSAAFMSSSGDASRHFFTRDEMEPYLLMYLEESRPTLEGHYMRAARTLINHYRGKRDLEQIITVIDLATQKFDQHDWDYHELKLEEIEAAIDFREFEKAEQLISKYEGEMVDIFSDTDLQLAHLKGEQLFRKGDREEAIAYLEKVIEEHQDWHDDLLEEMESHHAGEGEYVEPGLTGSPYFNDLVDLLDQLLTSSPDDDYSQSTVTGKVKKSNGEPLSNVRVVLRDARKTAVSTMIDERYDTVTDMDGSFTFEGVSPGDYHLMLGLLFEQVDGWAWPVEPMDTIIVENGEKKEVHAELTPLIETYHPRDYDVIKDEEITFSWEDYPGAESYTLFLTRELSEGGSASNVVKGNIEDSEVTIQVDDIYSLGGALFSEEEWKNNLYPANLLGFANPEGSYSWYVQAYDGDGKIIGQSNGYRLREETMGSLPFFYLKERELTEADRLLIDGEIEKAYDKYKEAAFGGDEDIHSLRMLTRLKHIEGEWGQEAVDNFFALAEADPNPENYRTILRYYYGLGNWIEVMNWYDKIRELEPIRVGDSNYEKGMYSVALIKKGQYDEALTLLYEVMENDSYNNFVGYMLALELYNGKGIDEVKELAKTYPEPHYYDNTDWRPYLERLENSDVDLETIKEALGYYFTGEEERLGKIVEGKSSLSEFISRLEEIR